LSENKEETQCFEELNQLAEEICACRASLAQAYKEMKSETRRLLKSRNSKAEILGQRMETLKINEQDLSFELAALMEQKRLILLDETEKTKLKMRTDRELFDLKFSFCSKVKEKALSSSSSSFM